MSKLRNALAVAVLAALAAATARPALPPVVFAKISMPS